MNTRSRRFTLACALGFMGVLDRPAAAGVTDAMDVNPDPHVFEAYLTADEQDLPINGTLVHAMVYRDETTGLAGIPGPGSTCRPATS